MNPAVSALEHGMLRWLDTRMGPLIAAIDSVDFYPRLMGVVRETADSDSVVILSYHRDHSPLVLFENLAPRDLEALRGCYFDGAYLLSPFYLRWQDSQDASGIYRLRDIVPEGFFDSVYYTDYYLGSGLRDEIAYLVPIGPDSAVLISLGRTDKLPYYTGSELDLLAAMQHIVANCVKKHAALAMDSGRARLSQQLSAHMLGFGTGILTDQEKRVVQLLLRGHSSKSCARELAISPTTERVHRRNIYAKMNISSQAELFTRFFDSLVPEAELPMMNLA